MGKLLDEIGSGEAAFIARQKVFFVATAPLDKTHHINLSPKAPGSSLIVLGPNKVAYADLTGSGAETAAHVLENQRMTLLFCNLEEGPPKILRLYGTAELIIKEKVDKSLLAKFPDSLTQNPGFRSIFVLTVERISSSCGYSLPIMTYQKTRTILDEYTERKGIEGMKDYGIFNNSFSIDGLPSVAQLRNPNVTISPKPEEGYIRGKAASINNGLQTGSALQSYQKVIARDDIASMKNTLSNVVYAVALFGVGTLFGSFVLPQIKPRW
jgi:hypothetical protein